MTKIFFSVSLLFAIITSFCIVFLMMGKTPKIEVSCQKALIDEPIEIFVSNLGSHKNITLEASCKDKDNNQWVSHATFQANDKGAVNVAAQSPISGSYNGINPMGLFWSMVPVDKKIQHFSFDKNELEVCLSVFFQKKLMVQKTIYRLLISPDIEKRKIHEHGIVGTLFYPKNIKSAPAIIVVPGSSGGIPEANSQLLASHGYTVLALGYFGLNDLPEKLDNIPLEYFQNAMRWLKKQPEVNEKQLSLLGSSRGGELVLLLAATFPQEINAVISCVPSSLVYSGFPQVNEPAWTYKNSPITFVPSPYFEDISNAVKEGKVASHEGTFEDPWQMTPHFLYGMNKFHHAIKAATIPVEKIRCPILIISGEDDKLWPSNLHGKLIMERLDKKQSTIKRKHLHFVHTGHAILFPYPPYMPVIGGPIFIPEHKLWSQYGGNTEGNAYAAKVAWKEILSFLEKTNNQQPDRPKISVNTKKSLRDELVKISVSNLSPYEHITLEASCKDRRGNVWVSRAIFEADDNGTIDVATEAPLEGSYNSIDPMGLFWSMTPKNKETSFFAAGEKNSEILLSAYFNNEIIAQKTISRMLVSPDIEQKQIREQGLVGTLLYSKNMLKGPGVIVVSGSAGGVSKDGHLLASHGYVVFALGYFAVEGLPANLENINLEYFQKAMRWLKKQPNVDNKIALMGASRGGELVILLGAMFPEEMNAIISYVPSSIVYASEGNGNKPSWLYNNSPITFMPDLSSEDIVDGVKKGKIFSHKGTFEDPYEITQNFLYGLDKYHHIIEAASIPVENFRCPLLIISGDDDKIWPSTLYGKFIMERLQKKGSRIERKHLHYKNAGHMLTRQFLPAIGLPFYHHVDKNWYALGGTAEGNAHANKESWREVLGFLEKTLQ